MKYGLIGETLGHSFSPELHRLLGGYDYELTELKASELSAFFARREFVGVNVTIPYKQAVLPFLDEIDPAAAAIGAVNTVVNRGGRLWGYNTDLGGMTALIRRMGLDLRCRKVLILGTGGTAHTAHAASLELGAAEIRLVSRSGQNGALTYPEAMSHYADADVLINTTPVGMFPHAEASPVDLSAFPLLQGVVDAVYNPLRTRLVLDARRRGISAEGGLYMLIAQAALTAELFTGRNVPEDTVESVYMALLREKQNLVLIGMPGSGKTAVGREIAAKMGRDFIDLDEMIREQAGRPIAEIITRDGEATFRELEAQAVRETAGRTALVIATGGGCVLRAENVERLRQNGLLCLLDRPLDELLPSPDRPLADTRLKVETLYRRRMPIYRAAADFTVETRSNVSETADDVIRRFWEDD